MGVLNLLATCFALALTCAIASAQYKSDAMVGVRGGVAACKMMGVPKMLVSEGYYSGYTFSEDCGVCPTADIFFSYTIRNAPIGLEARFNYDQLKGSATYDDIEGFTYTTESTFHTIGASAHVKGYAYKGLYLSVGIGYCWNLTPGKFTYSSNSGDMDWGGKEVPTDMETAEEFAEAFGGNGSVFLPLALGYELPNSLSLEAFYHRGLNDVVATRANRHDFGETDNRISSFGIVVGWGFPMDTPDKHRHR